MTMVYDDGDAVTRELAHDADHLLRLGVAETGKRLVQ
jgi:hypothetical protein